MNKKRLPLGPSPLQRSSSATKKDNMVAEKVDERCRNEMTTQLVLYSAVKKFNVLSSKELGSLIREAENGIIKCTINGSSFQISVENLARHLVEHISNEVSSITVDEKHFRYLLRSLRLLHTLCDISSHHSTLARVVEDTSVQDEMINSIFRMIDFLSQSGEKISGSSQMVLLYSALLSSSMYLLKALISSKWQDVTRVLLAHSKVDKFTTTAFTALRVVMNSLQAKLLDQHIDSRMRSNANEVYCLYHICESSLLFLQSACKQRLFRERLVKNKELCGEGVVLQLVKDTLKLSHCEDPYLMNTVYWLKSKVVSIMLLLCEAESTSFLDMASSTPESKELAKSTVIEVLQVLKMMFDGDLKDHPRGRLQFNAMRLTEIFSGDIRFRTSIILHFTEVLTRVFVQPQKEFLSSWCSNDHEPIEEDNDMDFDSISAAGRVLGLISKSHVQHSTWHNFQGSQTPYAYQRSSLLVKILANLAYVPDLSEEENARFVNDFLECLQTESSTLPGGAAERTAAAGRNLSFLLNHAESLTPAYLNAHDVLVLRWFISQLEQPHAAQESDIDRAMEVHNSASPTPPSPSPNVDDGSGNDDEGVPVSMAIVQADYLASNENGQNQLSEDTTDQNTEPINSIQNVEEFRSVESEERRENKRRRTLMNDQQINFIEKALLDHPVMQKRDGSLQHWAAELSLLGSNITPDQLKNWLSNRKGKRARAAAKAARVHSDEDNALPEKETGSGPDPNSPENLLDEDYDPSPSTSQLTHRKDRRRSVSRTKDTVVVPETCFKFEVGQHVILTDDKGKEVGKGTIHLVKGVWSEKNLEESSSYVVAVEELKKSAAQSVPCEIKMLWNSSQLVLIQQQLP